MIARSPKVTANFTLCKLNQQVYFDYKIPGIDIFHISKDKYDRKLKHRENEYYTAAVYQQDDIIQDLR